MAAKFEIRSPTAGQFQWVLVSQGRTLATSQTYARRALAEKSIDSFRMAAIAAPVEDRTAVAATTTVRKAARAAGRAAGKVVATSGRAVDKAERAVAQPAKRAARTVKRAATKAPAGPHERDRKG
jgi:uncharacterized protein YegP (UPF0339 family)